MFIISITYTKELSLVERYFDAHVQFLDKYYAAKKFIVSGRKVPRTGGIILAHNVSKTELEHILKEDPFKKNHVAEYGITEFQPTKCDSHFNIFMN